MSDSELLSDLAQIPRDPALVLHHTGAADYLQISHLGQGGQDLVLHAVGKESVVRITAHILERKDGDTFSAVAGADGVVGAAGDDVIFSRARLCFRIAGAKIIARTATLKSIKPAIKSGIKSGERFAPSDPRAR